MQMSHQGKVFKETMNTGSYDWLQRFDFTLFFWSGGSCPISARPSERRRCLDSFVINLQCLPLRPRAFAGEAEALAKTHGSDAQTLRIFAWDSATSGLKFFASRRSCCFLLNFNSL